jgi:hypothetical protein
MLTGTSDPYLREAVVRDRRILALIAAAAVVPLVCAAGVIMTAVIGEGARTSSWMAWMSYLRGTSWTFLLQMTFAIFCVGFPLALALSWPAAIFSVGLIRRDHRLAIMLIVLWYVACGAIGAPFVWHLLWGPDARELGMPWTGGIAGLISGACFCLVALNRKPFRREIAAGSDAAIAS